MRVRLSRATTHRCSILKQPVSIWSEKMDGNNEREKKAEEKERTRTHTHTHTQREGRAQREGHALQWGGRALHHADTVHWFSCGPRGCVRETKIKRLARVGTRQSRFSTGLGAADVLKRTAKIGRTFVCAMLSTRKAPMRFCRPVTSIFQRRHTIVEVFRQRRRRSGSVY